MACCGSRRATIVVAQEVLRGSAGDRSGIKAGDVLIRIDAQEVNSVLGVAQAMHAVAEGRQVDYTIVRESSEVPLLLRLEPNVATQFGLYYSQAAVGIFSIIIGAAVRLRRPADEATLHFFWLSVAFFGAFAFHASGQFDHLDYFFDWADVVARLALPPLFLHFALVFPDRPNGVGSDRRRTGDVARLSTCRRSSWAARASTLMLRRPARRRSRRELLQRSSNWSTRISRPACSAAWR